MAGIAFLYYVYSFAMKAVPKFMYLVSKDDKIWRNKLITSLFSHFQRHNIFHDLINNGLRHV